MKKYINKIIGSAMVVSAMTLSACSSDYLETKPTQSVEEEEAMATTKNAMSQLNGIAKMMTTQQAYFGQGFAGENGVWWIYENFPSQNFNYNRMAGWAPIFNQQFHSRTSSPYDAYAWFYYYQLVAAANKIICHIDNAQGTDAEKKFIKASALTFRAYAFEKLTHYYCYRWQDSNNGSSRGIVLRTDESTDGLAYSTLAETYAQIYKDCDEAISLFNESGEDRGASEVWIPNLNVAHAVYARAALTKQDWQTALSHAKAARQGYALMSNTDYQKGFCNPTSEWIFSSYGSADENNWYWSYGTMFACNGYYANNVGWGASIGHELISRIPNNDARKQLFMTEDKYRSINIHSSADVHQSFGIIGLGNDDVWEQADSIAKAHKAPGFTDSYQSGYYFLDGQLKFWVFDTPGVGYLPLVRSSEMVLVEAEANAELGNTAAAQAALVELNATSGRNPEYTCTKTGDDLIQEIRDYRCLELWGEGLEWSDFKRWNIPIVRKTIANGGNTHPNMAKTIAIDDPSTNNWTWDVPKNETDYNDKLALPTDEK